VITYNYIENQQQLESCCQHLEKNKVLAIDTEFVRERTFYPLPGLIQVSDGSNIYLIDPRACNNLQVFFAIMESPDIVIIMHSSSEDIELFYSLGCDTIQNLFDTQIASAWLGMGQSLSLQKVVEHYENIVIEKQLSRTDWIKRPLSEAQLQYAATDVLYLNNMYGQQNDALANSNFLKNMKQDCDLLCEKKSIKQNDEKMYLKVKRAITATGGALTRLKAISEWREQQARIDNKPRQHVIKDEQILQICLEYPQTVEQLNNKCNIAPSTIRRYGKKLIDVANKAMNKNHPVKPVLSLRSLPNGGKAINDCRELVSKLQLQTGIPREVLPSKRWLEQFLLHHVADWYPQPEGWKGWRKELLELPFQQIFDKHNFTNNIFDNNSES